MNDPDPNIHDPLVRSVERQAERRRRWLLEGDAPVAQRLAQIGVLGWIIVTPMLIGVLLGHWLDAKLGSGVFWTAPFLILGLMLGCWSAWKWVNAS